MGTDQKKEKTRHRRHAAGLQPSAEVFRHGSQMNLGHAPDPSLSFQEGDPLDFTSPGSTTAASMIHAQNGHNTAAEAAIATQPDVQTDGPTSQLLSLFHHQDMPAMSEYPFLPFQQDMYPMHGMMDLPSGNESINQSSSSSSLRSLSHHRASMPSIYATESGSPAAQRTRRYTEGTLHVDSRTCTRQTSETEEDEDEKRRNFLERNRQAALKCRQRKKQWLADLQYKVDHLTTDNETLQHQAIVLREEVINLKTLLLAHKECPVAQSNGVIGIDALRLSHSSPSNRFFAHMNKASPISSASSYASSKDTSH